MHTHGSRQRLRLFGGDCERELLSASRLLLLDKKAALRRDAVRGLAAAYAAHLLRDARDAPATQPEAALCAMFDPLPGALLVACAWDVEGLGRGAVDALLDGELTPHALHPAPTPYIAPMRTQHPATL